MGLGDFEAQSKTDVKTNLHVGFLVGAENLG